MPTLEAAKTQAFAIAAALQAQAAQLRTLDPPIVGLSAQASALEASAAAIVVAANTAIEPPVIVLSRTTITPDDVPGSNDQEKVVNAHAEAVSRGRPMRWNRRYLVKGITLVAAHDGLEIIADPDCGPVLSNEIVNPQGLLYYIAPAAGQRAEITMRGVSLLGNRANTPTGPTQTGIVLGNPGLGFAKLIIEDCELRDFAWTGIQSWGDGCEVYGRGVRVTNCGMEAIGTTRGRMVLSNCEVFYCETGFNASAGEYMELRDCWAHHNAGSGAKISLRSGETPESGKAFKSRLHLVNTRIEDNGGTGLASTSAVLGSIISGSAMFARNAGGAINLTDETEGRFADVVSVGDGNHNDDNSASVLLAGAGRHRFRSLDIRNGVWRGVNGGWGRELVVGRLAISNCAGAGLRWVNAPIVYDAYTHADNGQPDELVNNG